jgi:hypothetical protein
MSCLRRTPDASDLARILIESTALFTRSRILHTDDLAQYTKSLNHCIYICSYERNGNDLVAMNKDLMRYAVDSLAGVSVGFELFSDIKRHHMMAIHQVSDIVTSMYKRFETGHSDSDSIFIQNITRRRT